MKYTFKVSVPTDEGFVGRQCNNSNCNKYFKVSQNSLKENMYCPYCALEHSKEDLLTDDQANYLRDVAAEKGKEIIANELNKMFTDLARKSEFWSFKGKKYRAKHIPPRYSEKKVDSEIICTKCKTEFQVYGIFGYCPGCKSENIQIYDANFEIIKKELEETEKSKRGLRHAYNDLVSTFQIVVEKHAKNLTTDRANFQNLFETRRFFKKHLDLDILADLGNDEELTLKRIFQKRHVYIHSGGVIEDKYVKKIPEDSKLYGQEAELSFEEFEKGVNALKKVLEILINQTT